MVLMSQNISDVFEPFALFDVVGEIGFFRFICLGDDKEI